MPAKTQPKQRKASRKSPLSATTDPRAAGFVEQGVALTTNQGLAIADNQNSLKSGARGSTLLEDFILREKITHFDHERIPERVVHARGSAAHGYFQVYKSLDRYTRAAFLCDAKVKTPVFVRFSTVAGGAGSADTVRDVRGFAVKFYTSQGNFDLVGNNIPVFFIQDAMKFPDLIHAVKMEPHNGMPQAGSAHDTFWDFVSLMPESTHMLLWAMSDRAIPRSLRMMQGFGVHTFKLVDAKGAVTLVKFHWKPLLGTHSLLWDEAQQIAGRDCDFHRRDLWEAIDQGSFPEWELGIQAFSEEEALQFPFDALDATKLVPEEMVPVIPVGRMVLNRNPDNFFAETEQVAFHVANIVPGIDFTADPLLQGRLFSYVDTQLIRLGGPNFHQIPVNRPQCPFHNLQRDGHMQQVRPKGRVAYEPSSLDDGSPAQVSPADGGFVTAPEPQEEKLRGRGPKFFDHYSQATLFFASQNPVEQDHIVSAFAFELGKVETLAVRRRMVANLRNVDEGLAAAVAAKLGFAPDPATPKKLDLPPPIPVAPSLSLQKTAYPSATRRVAILAADGVSASALNALTAAIRKAGADPKIVAPTNGVIQPSSGKPVKVDHAIATMAPVLFDALAIPEGAPSLATLTVTKGVTAFLVETFRHYKPIFLAGNAVLLLRAVNLTDDPDTLPAGVYTDGGKQAEAFANSLARRWWNRTMPPSLVP